MVADAAAINGDNYSYSAAGPNSNSVINALLSDVGLPLPQNEGLGQQYPAPGANMPLDSSSTAIQTELSAVLANLGNANSSAVFATELGLMSTGYYEFLSTDSNAASIATKVASFDRINITGNTLSNLNSVFVGSNFSTGGLIHIPLTETTLSTVNPTSFLPTLPTLSEGETYVLDPSSTVIDQSLPMLGRQAG